MSDTPIKPITWTKKSTIGVILLAFCAIVTVVGFVFHDDIFSIQGWCMTVDTGIGIVNAVLRLLPRLIESIGVLFVTLLVVYIVSTVVNRIFKGTPRKITIGKLVNSITKVVIWVICVIAVLAAWGVDVAALIAGAGVLTLIIGLGMQSLIADVVAGVFIVCDGTLQVGDIVTIDGWRGTVQEIGIRNTKLIDYSGNIRVANNSTIKVFINQSREDSYPLVYVGISYEEDIARVEKVLEDNRELLRSRLPRIIGYVDYLGVNKIGDSSILLQFGAKCKEEDFFQVQRDMNRELKVLFDENGIGIPFPQVVVHEAAKHEAATEGAGQAAEEQTEGGGGI